MSTLVLAAEIVRIIEVPFGVQVSGVSVQLSRQRSWIHLPPI